MSSADQEHISVGVEDEVIDGMTIRHHDEERTQGKGIQWVTEYLVGDARLEVIHTEDAPDTIVSPSHRNVFLAWTSRTTPALIPGVATNTPAPAKWEPAEPRSGPKAVASDYERLDSGNIRLVGRFSEESGGQPEVVLSFPLNAPGTAYLAEMLTDRTAHPDLIPHLPTIIEREHDLFGR